MELTFCALIIRFAPGIQKIWYDGFKMNTAPGSRLLFSDPSMMPEPPAELIAFVRCAFVLCALSDPEGAANIAARIENPAKHVAAYGADFWSAPSAGTCSTLDFLERARRAGLTAGDGEGFYNWLRSSRLAAAAYDYLCAGESGGHPLPT